MKRLLIVSMLFLIMSCTGQIDNATNPQESQLPDEQNEQTMQNHPADASIPLGAFAVIAAANWIDPIGSLASIDLLNDYVAKLALATTDSSDLILRSFKGLIFVINRFGADTIQVIPPDSYGIAANYSVGNGSNPQDIWVVSNDKAYISRLDAQNDPDLDDDILIVDPMTGELKDSIDLTPYMFDDGDQLVRAAQMVLVQDKLFVCLQDLPSDLLEPANASGKIAVIDIVTDDVVDVIELEGRNPADITYSPLTGLIYVTDSGVFDNFTTDTTDSYGGIEIINPNTLSTEGIKIDDFDLGGFPSEIRLSSATLGFVIVDGLYIASFNPTTYEVLDNAFYTTGGYYLPDFSIEESGNLLVTERSNDNPGIIVLDGQDGTVVAGPIPVGAPPASITFVDIN